MTDHAGFRHLGWIVKICFCPG